MSQVQKIKEVMTRLQLLTNEVLPGGSLQSDQPKVGYFCSFVPAELLLAAGIHPIRLNGLGVDDSSTGDAYMSHLTCSFARHVVSALVDGHYDFLDGQISANMCDHIRMANEVIRAKSSVDFHGFITVPRSDRESLLSWYREELCQLRSTIGEHFGTEITDASLDQAIQEMNQVRDRVSRIDELRRRDPPCLSGTQALTAFLAARVLVPERFIQLADQLIRAAQQGDPIQGIRARILLYGGELDDPRFIQVIESQGAHVAGDLLCYGARGMGNRITENGDPLHAIAQAYLNQIPCARMMGEFPARYQKLRRLYDEVKAEGILFQRIKFCQIWSNEAHNLMHRFKTEPLPLLIIDREYGTVSTGQLKTRVQGFLERLERRTGNFSKSGGIG